ncbi:AbrB/MazE/SpoVT family DNA-binding domain-containing protein [Variovorax sp. GT1P44]|uniref:AbrB/MazE/SpoVT family DNA-binding domain-containing protein n=1 Tax=Variovorax sp. GT1P44 TaxID=3443742 RepID=UPI003F4809E2
MSQRTLRIIMSEPFRDYIHGRVARGGCVNTSEYIRELVHRDQETQAYKRLRDLIHGDAVPERKTGHHCTLTSSGRITIPREIRDRLGLQAGDEVSFAVLDNGFVAVRVGTSV